jgi:hypothetical protein
LNEAPRVHHAANTLGLNVPNTLLVSADEVIE